MIANKAFLATLVAFLAATPQDKESKVSDASAPEQIIDCINNSNNNLYERKINFDNSAAPYIEKIGYKKMIKDYHNMFGRIIACSTPTSLPRLVRYQIFAEKGRWSMIVGAETDGSVYYLHFVDPDPIIPRPERSAKPMRLPFRGEWFVAQGGPTPEKNYHIEAGDRASRFAIDFTVHEPDGNSFRGDDRKLENYTAFGREILAAADGEIVIVVDGVPDNRPFTVNPMTNAGNIVVIKHADYQFSLYAHLKKNSIRVKVGQKVSSGEIIGQCGNSGYSSFPHLHFDMTNTEVANDATGFAPYFRDVILKRNGVRTIQMDYTPLRDDSIQPRE
jgi:Peptidase family M23